MAIAYLTISGLTFAVVLNAFLKDRTTANSSLKAWLFVVVSAMIWPITLPFIISSKLRMAKARASQKAGFSAPLSTAPAADS